MKNIKIIVIVGILLLTTVLPIIKADVSQQSENAQNNLLEYKYINKNELVITFHLSELHERQVTTEKGSFIQFQIPNSGFFGEIGSPQLPVVTKIVAVSTPQCSLEIISQHIQKTCHVSRIYPVQNPQSDDENDEKSDFIYDESAYQRNDFFPDQIVEIVDSGKIRDIPFVKIRFYPIKYNPYQQIVTIYDTIDIKLIFSPNIGLLVEPDYTQKPFYPFYESVFDNWLGFVSNTVFQEQIGSKDIGCDYLIITHQNWYSQAQELAEWKYSNGLFPKLINVSDIGTTYQQIRQYLVNAYMTWVPRPSYILLIGDAEFIPTTYVNDVATDLWYAAVSGTDYYPDLFIGRIPADSYNQAQVMIQKTLSYERTPPTLPSFYNNFVVAAYFQDSDNYDGYEDRRFVLTSEEVRDYLLSEGYEGERIYCTESYVNPTHYNNGYYANGEPLPTELLRPTFAWDGSGNDIINAIQQGIFILNHRDHGMISGWSDPYFTTDDFNSFSNGDLLPVVFSINCLTGKFDTDECFCEEFLRKEDGGAIATFGATRVSYSGYNDYFCRGLYDGVWPEFDLWVGYNNISLYTLGEILNYGKTYMADTWGDPWNLEEYEFELFHCFGDPSLDMYTAFPEALEVICAISSEEIQVTVNGNGIPVQGARVCISQDSGYYRTGITEMDGMIEFNYTEASIAEEVSLVVTAHNYLYYSDYFIINQKPEKPNRPTGPTEGNPNVEYTFKTSTIDANGDSLFYNFSWGDGTNSGWVGPYVSGVTASANKAWTTEGSYNITVKAKDVYDAESDWSDPLPVTMPCIYNIPLHWFWERFFQMLPNEFPLLRHLMGY